jgi:hypothetical protein
MHNITRMFWVRVYNYSSESRNRELNAITNGECAGWVIQAVMAMCFRLCHARIAAEAVGRFVVFGTNHAVGASVTQEQEVK